MIELFDTLKSMLMASPLFPIRVILEYDVINSASELPNPRTCRAFFLGWVGLSVFLTAFFVICELAAPESTNIVRGTLFTLVFMMPYMTSFDDFVCRVHASITRSVSMLWVEGGIDGCSSNVSFNTDFEDDTGVIVDVLLDSVDADDLLYRAANCQSKNSSGREFSISLPMFTISRFGFFGHTTK